MTVYSFDLLFCNAFVCSVPRLEGNTKYSEWREQRKETLTLIMLGKDRLA